MVGGQLKWNEVAEWLNQLYNSNKPHFVHWFTCTLNHLWHLCPKRTSAFSREWLQSLEDWLYLLDVFKGLNKGMAQSVQVGLWLLQMCNGLIKSHPCCVHPFLLAAAVASFFALLTKLAEGSGGSLYHLRPRLGAQLEAAYRGQGEGGGENRVMRTAWEIQTHIFWFFFYSDVTRKNPSRQTKAACVWPLPVHPQCKWEIISGSLK